MPEHQGGRRTFGETLTTEQATALFELQEREIRTLSGEIDEPDQDDDDDRAELA